MKIHPNDLGRQVMLPRTLPVTSMADLAPYHFTPGKEGGYSLRKGAPPKVVAHAANDFAEGRTSLGDFLDRLGVPKS